MNRFAMSRSAAGLLRALLDRASADRNRILLTEITSTDWQSLTFIGERHRMRLVICGDDAEQILERLLDGLADADLPVPGQIVADIALFGAVERRPDSSLGFELEALTIAAGS